MSQISSRESKYLTFFSHRNVMCCNDLKIWIQTLLKLKGVVLQRHANIFIHGRLAKKPKVVQLLRWGDVRASAGEVKGQKVKPCRCFCRQSVVWERHDHASCVRFRASRQDLSLSASQTLSRSYPIPPSSSAPPPPPPHTNGLNKKSAWLGRGFRPNPEEW